MRRVHFLNLILSYILLTLFLYGCVTSPPKQYIRDGKEYGTVSGSFRHRWWNYYERALSFMEGEFYDEALADLKQAAEQRYEDKRMARTYGMHFIDYFPHREVGLVYYLTGQYEAAGKELELSLQQQPSAKAQYYLDKIRRILMEREKTIVSAPVLMVDLPSRDIWSREDSISISGSVRDEQYVARVTVAEKNVFLDASSREVIFKEELRLDQGEHNISIIAENLLGGTVQHEVVIHVDRQGPVITLDTYPEDTGIMNLVQGVLYDESGGISLTVNGVQIPVPRGEEAPFSAQILPGTTHVDILTSDRLGNETKARFPLESLKARKSYPLLAYNDNGTVASDAGGINLAFSLGKKDSRKPAIKLKGWSDEQSVFLDKAYIEGEVRDENNIVALAVNDTPVLRRQGRMIFFNHLVDLREGNNTIRVEARDKSGNISVKEIVIIRQVPSIFQTDSRFSMTMLPFESKGLITGLADMYENLFLSRLMDRNRFRIIEREKLDIILQEQKLSSSKLVDRATALELGKMVAAQASLVANFIETRLGIEVVARLIDNETSELLAVKDVYDEFKDRAALSDLAEGLSVKFHREFPLVNGVIVQKEDDSLFTDLGMEKTKARRRLIVYREGKELRHPDTGRILGCDTEIIGYARVTQVMNELSKAELLKGLKIEDISDKDKVMSE